MNLFTLHSAEVDEQMRVRMSEHRVAVASTSNRRYPYIKFFDARQIRCLRANRKTKKNY